MSCCNWFHLRIFGCPAHILDPRLQDGKKISKWEPDASEPGTLTCDDLTVTLPSEDGSGEVVVDARGNVVFEDTAEGLVSKCSHLHYEQSLGRIELRGVEDRPARVRRVSMDPTTEDGSGETEVSIVGPVIYIDQETRQLDCPEDGRVVMVQPARVGSDGERKKDQRVVARSKGPVQFANDELTLRRRVVVTFEEDGEEAQALWCDLATVHFHSESGPTAPAVTSGSTDALSGFDRIVAEGRVHMEQISPRELVGEGQRLEWWIEDGQRGMVWSGTRPQCWVTGLMSDK